MLCVYLFFWGTDTPVEGLLVKGASHNDYVTAEFVSRKLQDSYDHLADTDGSGDRGVEDELRQHSTAKEGMSDEGLDFLPTGSLDASRIDNGEDGQGHATDGKLRHHDTATEGVSGEGLDTLPTSSLDASRRLEDGLNTGSDNEDKPQHKLDTTTDDSATELQTETEQDASKQQEETETNTETEAIKETEAHKETEDSEHDAMKTSTTDFTFDAEQQPWLYEGVTPTPPTIDEPIDQPAIDDVAPASEFSDDGPSHFTEILRTFDSTMNQFLHMVSLDYLVFLLLHTG